MPEKKRLNSGAGYTVRDNTRVPGVNVGYVPAKEYGLPAQPDVRIDDGPMGFIPVVGDVLQAGQALIDLGDKKYGRAAMGAGLLLLPNVAEKPLKAATRVLRRKLSRGQLTKILEDLGEVKPLVSEKGKLRFTGVKPRKADFYIETDVPVSGVLEREAEPSDYFGHGAYSTRYQAEEGFVPNLFDNNVKVYRRSGNGKYIQLDKEELLDPNLREYGISNREIQTEKPVRLSEHRIHLPESPSPVTSGSTFYLDEAISPYVKNANLPEYRIMDKNLFGYSGSYYDPVSGNFIRPHGSDNESAKILRSKIANSEEASDVAKSMVPSAKKYYLENYDVATDALTDDEWANLTQTLIDKNKDKEILFHSTGDKFDKVEKDKLLKKNEGFLGRGFYVSDIPQDDYGPIVMPITMPRGKQIVLERKNGFLHADNREADDVLKELRRPRVRWTKKGFESTPWGFWPGITETSKSPEAWNNMIKGMDLNFVKSRATSKGVGYKYPEVMIPEDKVGLIEMLYKEPSQLKNGGLLSRLQNHYGSNEKVLEAIRKFKEGGQIHIAPSKKGTFTAAAKKHGKSVQAFASQVLANKENYSPAMVKKANFARNAAKWHAMGGPIGKGYISVEDPDFVGPVLPVEDDIMIDRQRYAESTYNDLAYNKGSKAQGAFQITPVVYDEYTKRTGKKGDLNDPNFNRAVRDWYMNERLPEFQMYRLGAPSDSNRVGRLYASFNAGPGKVLKALRQAEVNGIDINRGFGFLQYLPKETQDYVNFNVRGKDIPGTSKTAAAQKKARANLKGAGGIVERYGSDAVRAALARLKG